MCSLSYRCTVIPRIAVSSFLCGRIYQLLEANNVYTISIPANRTDKLQPMDQSVNKTLKDFIKKEFNEWYFSVVYNTHDSDNPAPADLRKAVMNPLAHSGY